MCGYLSLRDIKFNWFIIKIVWKQLICDTGPVSLLSVTELLMSKKLSIENLIWTPIFCFVNLTFDLAQRATIFQFNPNYD